MKRDEKVIKSLWKMPAKMVKASVSALASVPTGFSLFLFHFCFSYCLGFNISSSLPAPAMATNIE